MSDDIAVRVDNIGKQYRIGTRRAPGTVMMREVLTDLAAAPFRKLRALARRLAAGTETLPQPAGADHIWALRNVSFTVPRGQVIGIIGPNGAGKSTLLKVLSRITEPTEGRVEIHGRVGSLLEVGTGFHPELTGLENVFLSGALLGMRKVEIERNLDEIVAFSEIEKFIDTPVKHYSSGMYVRLAFSVAAHLEPEILIVDEVLAVGDVSFQRKCLNKMEDVHQHGRTILFVSHNMDAVTRLCERALLISHGGIQKDGPASDVASAYLLSTLKTDAIQEWPIAETAPGNAIARLRRVRVRDEAGATVENIDVRQPVGIEMVFDVLTPGRVMAPSVMLYARSGTCVFSAHDLDPEWRQRQRPAGSFTATAWIPGNLLAEGALLVSCGLGSIRPLEVHFFVREAVAFNVTDPGMGDSARGDWDGSIPGVVRPLLKWQTAYRPLSGGLIEGDA
jgi:lipopolysaccharide transport system ATP-binding protein